MSDVAMITSGAAVIYSLKVAAGMSPKTHPGIVVGIILLGVGAFIELIWRLGYTTSMVCSEDTHTIVVYAGAVMIMAFNRRRL